MLLGKKLNQLHKEIELQFSGCSNVFYYNYYIVVVVIIKILTKFLKF